jgi:hypothetical protein
MMQDCRAMDHDDLARLLGAGRVAIGGTLLVAPGTASSWAGPAAADPGAKMLTRAAGIRDLLLGVLLLRALDQGAPVRALLQCGAVADGVDLVATLTTFRHLPRRTRLTAVGAAAGAVLTGLTLAQSLD